MKINKEQCNTIFCVKDKELNVWYWEQDKTYTLNIYNETLDIETTLFKTKNKKELEKELKKWTKQKVLNYK